MFKSQIERIEPYLVSGIHGIGHGVLVVVDFVRLKVFPKWLALDLLLPDVAARLQF